MFLGAESMSKIPAWVSRGWSLALIAALAGCAVDEVEPDHHDHDFEAGELETRSSALTVGEVTGCSLAAVRGLDTQIIDEMNCVAPNSLVNFADLNVELGGSSTWALLQPSAREGFRRAIARRGQRFRVNSAYRTIAQQYLLYRWYQQGVCGIGLAAPPGSSNHQSGLAVDVSDYTGWRPHMEAEGWDWLGNSDPVHFDYRGGGTRDIRGTAILAFQRLWNRNHPNDRIAEDGDYGPQTEGKLRQSPPGGFPTGAVCDEPEPEPEPAPEPPDVHVTVSGLDAPPEGQPAGLFEAGSSRGVLDLVEGQRLKVDFVVRNGADRASTDQILVGFEVAEPFVTLRAYTIFTDHPALDGRTWRINDSDAFEGNPSHDRPGAGGLFNVLAFSPGESKRIALELEAEAASGALPGHAAVRLWVKHVGGYYGEMDGWEDAVEVNRAGTLLRRETLIDVYSPDGWVFEGAAPEDTEGWIACNADTTLTLDAGVDQLVGQSAVGEACVESPSWTRIDASAYPGLLLRARHEGDERGVRMIWRREGEDWPSARSMRFDLPAELGDVALDLSRSSDWSGQVVGLRLLATSPQRPILALEAVEPLATIPADAVNPEDDDTPLDPGDPVEPEPEASPEGQPDAQLEPEPFTGERFSRTSSSCAQVASSPHGEPGGWALLALIGLAAVLRRPRSR